MTVFSIFEKIVMTFLFNSNENAEETVYFFCETGLYFYELHLFTKIIIILVFSR